MWTSVFWEEGISKRGYCGVGYSAMGVVCGGATEGRGSLWAGVLSGGGILRWGSVGYDCVGWITLMRCQSIVTGLTTSSDNLNFTPIQFSLNIRTCNVALFLIFTDKNRK